MGVCSVGHIAGDLKWSGVDKFCEWLLERIALCYKKTCLFSWQVEPEKMC